MDQVLINKTTLTAIGDAIREKEGSTEPIPVIDMASRISGIASISGKRFTTGSVTFTTAQSQQIVTHNLGVVPSVFIMYPIDTPPEYGAEINNRTYASTSILVPSIGRTGTFYRYNSSGNLLWGQSESFGDDTTNTETTIQPSYYRNYAYVANFKYGWIAIE